MNKSPELKTATQRALHLFDNAHIGADPFEKTIGVAQGTIKNLKNGKNLISADCIIKFARYFNVSADYLLCLTDEPNVLSTNTDTSTELIKRPKYAVSDKFMEDYMNLLNDKHFANIAKVYNKFNEEYQIQIYTYIVTLATKIGLNVANILNK